MDKITSDEKAGGSSSGSEIEKSASGDGAKAREIEVVPSN